MMVTASKISRSDLRTSLQTLLKQNPNSLNAAVASAALDTEDPSRFFSDLLQHGCQSGMVGSLIYYHDTHAFFDQHYDAIENLREETEDNLGEAIAVTGDLKNFFAWFAFEETAYQLALKLGLIE